MLTVVATVEHWSDTHLGDLCGRELSTVHQGVDHPACDTHDIREPLGFAHSQPRVISSDLDPPTPEPK